MPLSPPQISPRKSDAPKSVFSPPPPPKTPPPKTRTPKRRAPARETSIGTMISTVCFAMLGLFFALETVAFYEAGYRFKSIGLACAACACCAGAMRFIIQDLLLSLNHKEMGKK